MAPTTAQLDARVSVLESGQVEIVKGLNDVRKSLDEATRRADEREAHRNAKLEQAEEQAAAHKRKLETETADHRRKLEADAMVYAQAEKAKLDQWKRETVSRVVMAALAGIPILFGAFSWATETEDPVIPAPATEAYQVSP